MSRGRSADDLLRRIVEALERGADFGQEFVLHDAVPELDRRRKTFRVGAAVTLDDDAVEPKKDAAIGAARIHALAQALERRAREQIADAGAPRTVHRPLEIFAELARGAFRGLERDIAGKAFGDHHVDLAAADIVAFDKTLIVETGQAFFTQDTPGLAHLFVTLGLFGADIEKTHAGSGQPEQDSRGRRAHDCE